MSDPVQTETVRSQPLRDLAQSQKCSLVVVQIDDTGNAN